MTVISVSAPTLDSSSEPIMVFYEDLRSVRISIPHADKFDSKYRSSFLTIPMPMLDAIMRPGMH